MADGRMKNATPFTLVYGVSRDEATRFGLPCGGTLELVVEPAPDLALLDELAERLDRRERVRRLVDIGVSRVQLAPAQRDDVLQWDGLRLSSVLGPQWRLLIIGAGQISRYLGPMAQALDYEVKRWHFFGLPVRCLSAEIAGVKIGESPVSQRVARGFTRGERSNPLLVFERSPRKPNLIAMTIGTREDVHVLQSNNISLRPLKISQPRSSFELGSRMNSKQR
jgi:hypothetical protein